MQAASSSSLIAFAYVLCCSAARLDSWSAILRRQRVHKPDVTPSEAVGVEESTYGHTLTGDWPTLSFQERWDAFSNVVPHQHLQERGTSPMTCKPAMFPIHEGQPRFEQARHLVVVLHGYLGCPGSYNTLLPSLEAALPEFLIMFPTLPGHGRWYSEEGDKKIDDLSKLPTQPQDYVDFAAAVTMLAESFNQEQEASGHEPIIALIGHSLGALLASKIAIDSPMLFNRVLVLNPSYEFPASIKLAKKVLAMASKPTDRWSLASLEMLGGNFTGCEKRREWNTDGGYCQFTLQHNIAVDQLTKLVYKEEWGLGKGGVVTQTLKNAFTQLRSFQMIATKNDNAVDNDAVIQFMDTAKIIQPPGTQRGMCFLPKDFTHNYIAQSAHTDGPTPERDFWFEHRFNQIVAEYLATGLPVSTVIRPKRLGYGYCMPKKRKSTAGKGLTILPAEQRGTAYEIAQTDDAANKPGIHTAAVLYQAVARKDTKKSSRLHARHMEFLQLGDDILWVTRKSENGNPKISLVSSSGAIRDHDMCLTLKLVNLKGAPQPLLPQLDTARAKLMKKGGSVRRVCDIEQDYIRMLCDLLSCEDKA